MNKIISLITIFLLLSGCLGSPNEENWERFNGTEWPSGVPASEFKLINQDGEEVSLSDFENKIVVLAFTFSTCPDICPMIEYNMNLAKESLGESYGNDVVFISISIDPLIDTPERMKSYWHEGLGYNWDHLTHNDTNIIDEVLKSYAIVVDKTYIQAHTIDENPINASDNLYDDLWIVIQHWNMFSENGQRHVKTPSAINYIQTMLPQHTNVSESNSSFLNSDDFYLSIYNGINSESIIIDAEEINENVTGWNLTLEAMNSKNLSYSINITNNNQEYILDKLNEEDIDDWHLMFWNQTNKIWEKSFLKINSSNINQLYDSKINNLAIIKNNTNTSNLSIEIRDNDMCGLEYTNENTHYIEIIEEIYSWCKFDINDTYMLEKITMHITNYSENTDNFSNNNSNQEYNLGHSTVTLILDRDHYRRVAWTGFNWDYELFVEDIKLLINE